MATRSAVEINGGYVSVTSAGGNEMQGLNWCIEACVLAIVVAAPWAFGAVHPPFELWVAYAIAASLALCGVRAAFSGDLHWPAARAVTIVATGLYALFLIATLHKLELPAAWIQAVSPNVSRTVAELVPTEREVLAGQSAATPMLAGWNVGPHLSLNVGGSYHFSLRIMALAVLFLMVSSLPTPRAVLLRVSIVSAAVGSALALFALAQYFSSNADQIYWFFDFRGGGFGSFINRNHYPFFANMTLGLSIGLLLDRYQRTDRGWVAFLAQDMWAKWILAAIVFIMVSIVVCVSRGGFVSMVLALAVCLATRFRREHRYGTTLVALSVVVGAALLLTWIGFDLFASRLSTLSESEQMREDGRWQLWQSAVSTIVQFPLFGSGGETFRYWETILNQDLRWNSSVQLALRADNEFLDVFAEYGIFGSIALLTIAVTVLWQGYRLAQIDGLAAGAFMALVAVIAHSMLDFGLRVPASGVLATTIAALVCSLVYERHSSRAGHRSRRKHRRTHRSERLNPAETHEPSLAQSAGSAPSVSMPQAQQATTASERLPVSQRVTAVGFCAVCLLLAAFLVLEKRRHASAYNLQAAGMRALKEGDVERCVELMSTGAQVAPEDVQTEIKAARICLIAADWTSEPQQRQHSLSVALRHCILARDLCPLAYEPHLWLGLNRESLASGRSKMEYLQAAHRLHPSEAEISFALGQEYLQKQMIDEAWNVWRSSLTFSSRHLPEILEQARQRLKPQEMLTQVLPDNSQRLYEAATIAENAKQTEEARVYLTRTLELLPTQASTDAAETAKTANTFELAARAHQRLDDPDKAIEAYTQALRYNPSANDWRIALAQLLIKQARYEEAARELRTVLVFDAENVTAKSLRDRALRLQKEASK